jgi:pilus assembly protein CpaE
VARLTALLVSDDEAFRRDIGAQLRSGPVGIRVLEDRSPHDGAAPDIVVVDIRTAPSIAPVERMRASSPAAAVFAVASAMDPDRILQAMRAGANEFFAWPPADDTLHEALRRTAARRESSGAPGAKSNTLVFVGAKGGAGTTTLAVNSAVELARLSRRPTLVVDLQPFVGEVALFLGVRPRFTVVDALDNLHRIDSAFLRELVARHATGLDVLAAGDQADRPSEQDATAVERLLQLLSEHYEHLVIDAGRVTGACTEAAVCAADMVYVVANPDVPSIRNTQRVIERMRHFGAGRERVRVLLNRTSNHHMIAPRQIESVLGYGVHHSFPSDYSTVATALNSGVPLTETNHSELAGQFSRFTRDLLNLSAEPEHAETGRRGILMGLF